MPDPGHFSPSWQLIIQFSAEFSEERTIIFDKITFFFFSMDRVSTAGVSMHK